MRARRFCRSSGGLREMGAPSPAPGEILWTTAALRRVENAPAFVRSGIYKLMVKRARELGQPLISSDFLSQIRDEAMLRVTRSMKRMGFEELHPGAFEVAKQRLKRSARKLEVLEAIQAFLAQRSGRSAEIVAKFRDYFESLPERGLLWTPEAEARMEKVPPFVRPMVREKVEAEARKRKQTVVTPPLLEAVFEALVPAPVRGMLRSRTKEPLPSGPRRERGEEEPTVSWSLEAVEELRRIEDDGERRRALERVASFAQERGLSRITASAFAAALGAPLRPPDRP
ncbi:MAG: PCP reductase family protein [Nitrospinota bacterium]